MQKRHVQRASFARIPPPVPPPAPVPPPPKKPKKLKNARQARNYWRRRALRAEKLLRAARAECRQHQNTHEAKPLASSQRLLQDMMKERPHFIRLILSTVNVVKLRDSLPSCDLKCAALAPAEAFQICIVASLLLRFRRPQTSTATGQLLGRLMIAHHTNLTIRNTLSRLRLIEDGKTVEKYLKADSLKFWLASANNPNVATVFDNFQQLIRSPFQREGKSNQFQYGLVSAAIINNGDYAYAAHSDPFDVQVCSSFYLPAMVCSG